MDRIKSQMRTRCLRHNMTLSATNPGPCLGVWGLPKGGKNQETIQHPEIMMKWLLTKAWLQKGTSSPNLITRSLLQQRYPCFNVYKNGTILYIG